MQTRGWMQLCLGLAALLLLPMSLHAAPVGNFTFVSGEVTVTRAGTVQVAVKDTAVEVGDLVHTGDKARAEVRFVDGTVMRVARDSNVEIKKYLVQAQALDVKLHLAKGKIQNLVPQLPGRIFGKEAPSKFEVDTPVATCGVRGTDFITSHLNGVSQATFLSGQGYAFNIKMPQQVVQVGAGQTMEIAQPDAPPVVRPAAPGELSGQDAAMGDKEAQAGEAQEAEEPLAFTPAETPAGPKINVQAVLPPSTGTISPSTP